MFFEKKLYICNKSSTGPHCHTP